MVRKQTSSVVGPPLEHSRAKTELGHTTSDDPILSTSANGENHKKEGNKRAREGMPIVTIMCREAEYILYSTTGKQESKNTHNDRYHIPVRLWERRPKIRN